MTHRTGPRGPQRRPRDTPYPAIRCPRTGTPSPPVDPPAGEPSPLGRRAATDAAPLPRLYTPAEAADLLTVGESWLRRKAAARVVPCTLLGKHLRFSAADLAAIAAAAARPPLTGPGATRRRGPR